MLKFIRLRSKPHLLLRGFAPDPFTKIDNFSNDAKYAKIMGIFVQLHPIIFLTGYNLLLSHLNTGLQPDEILKKINSTVFGPYFRFKAKEFLEVLPRGKERKSLKNGRFFIKNTIPL